MSIARGWLGSTMERHIAMVSQALLTTASGGLNGRRLEAESEALYELVDGVAAGSVDKAEVPVFPRQNSVSR